MGPLELIAATCALAGNVPVRTSRLIDREPPKILRPGAQRRQKMRMSGRRACNDCGKTISANKAVCFACQMKREAAYQAAAA